MGTGDSLAIFLVEANPPESPSLVLMERDITDRCFRFAVRIVRLCRDLDQMAGVYWVVSRQLAKAGTSIAANMEEAQGAQSRADFNAKLYISLKECRETLYWLRLLNESELVPTEQITEITEESDQLVRILTAITNKTRKPKNKRT